MCIAEMSQTELYEEHNLHLRKIVFQTERDKLISKWRPDIHNHRGCHRKGFSGGSEISVSLLRVCRQTYLEASRVLYASNVFSFRLPKTFRSFFLAPNLAHKNLLGRFIYQSWSTNFSYVAHDDVVKWNRVLCTNVVHHLQILRVLHIGLTLDWVKEIDYAKARKEMSMDCSLLIGKIQS